MGTTKNLQFWLAEYNVVNLQKKIPLVLEVDFFENGYN